MYEYRRTLCSAAPVAMALLTILCCALALCAGPFIAALLCVATVAFFAF